MCELGGEANVILLLKILVPASLYSGAISHVVTRRLEFSVLFGKRSRETLLQDPLGHECITHGAL